MQFLGILIDFYLLETYKQRLNDSHSIDWVGIFNSLFTDVLFLGLRNNIVKLGSKFSNDI